MQRKYRFYEVYNNKSSIHQVYIKDFQHPLGYLKTLKINRRSPIDDWLAPLPQGLVWFHVIFMSSYELRFQIYIHALDIQFIFYFKHFSLHLQLFRVFSPKRRVELEILYYFHLGSCIHTRFLYTHFQYIISYL